MAFDINNLAEQAASFLSRSGMANPFPTPAPLVIPQAVLDNYTGQQLLPQPSQPTAPPPPSVQQPVARELDENEVIKALFGDTAANKFTSSPPQQQQQFDYASMPPDQALYLMLRQRGMPPAGAAAATGNAAHESSFRTGALGDYQGGVPTSGGIFQLHDGPVAKRYTKASQFVGKPFEQASMEEQVDYLVHELQTDFPGLYKDLMTGDDVERLSKRFTIEFENPADKHRKAAERAKSSQEYFKKFQGLDIEPELPEPTRQPESAEPPSDLGVDLSRIQDPAVRELFAQSLQQAQDVSSPYPFPVQAPQRTSDVLSGAGKGFIQGGTGGVVRPANLTPQEQGPATIGDVLGQIAVSMAPALTPAGIPGAAVTTGGLLGVRDLTDVVAAGQQPTQEDIKGAATLAALTGASFGLQPAGGRALPRFFKGGAIEGGAAAGAELASDVMADRELGVHPTEVGVPATIGGLVSLLFGPTAGRAAQRGLDVASSPVRDVPALTTDARPLPQLPGGTEVPTAGQQGGVLVREPGGQPAPRPAPDQRQLEQFKREAGPLGEGEFVGKRVTGRVAEGQPTKPRLTTEEAAESLFGGFRDKAAREGFGQVQSEAPLPPSPAATEAYGRLQGQATEGGLLHRKFPSGVEEVVTEQFPRGRGQSQPAPFGLEDIRVAEDADRVALEEAFERQGFRTDVPEEAITPPRSKRGQTITRKYKTKRSANARKDRLVNESPELADRIDVVRVGKREFRLHDRGPGRVETPVSKLTDEQVLGTGRGLEPDVTTPAQRPTDVVPDDIPIRTTPVSKAGEPVPATTKAGDPLTTIQAGGRATEVPPLPPAEVTTTPAAGRSVSLPPDPDFSSTRVSRQIGFDSLSSARDAVQQVGRKRSAESAGVSEEVFNKVKGLDPNVRQVLKTNFDETTGLGQQVLPAGAKSPQDLAGRGFVRGERSLVDRKGQPTGEKVFVDPAATKEVIDRAIETNTPITRNYRGEASGVTTGRLGRVRDIFTPLFYTETKSGKVLVHGYNEEGRYTKSFLDDLEGTGSGFLEVPTLLPGQEPFRGAYANIAAGPGQYRIRDVLEAGSAKPIARDSEIQAFTKATEQVYKDIPKLRPAIERLRDNPTPRAMQHFATTAMKEFDKLSPAKRSRLLALVESLCKRK